MHFNTYKHHESITGPIIEETAKESCLRAALEEKKLLFQNSQDICKQLPPEIAQNIYPSLNHKDLQFNEVIVKNRNEENSMMLSQNLSNGAVSSNTNDGPEEALAEKSSQQLSKSPNFSDTNREPQEVVLCHPNKTTTLNKQ